MKEEYDFTNSLKNDPIILQDIKYFINKVIKYPEHHRTKNQLLLMMNMYIIQEKVKMRFNDE